MMVSARTEQSTTTTMKETQNIKGGSLVDVSLTMTLYNHKMHG